MIPITIPPITPPTIAPTIALALEVLLLLAFAIELDCVGEPLSMLVALETPWVTSGPVRVVLPITVDEATKGGKEESDANSDADADKLIPGREAEFATSGWVRINESTLRSISSVALVLVMVIV
jgi:hypothetical protein